MNSFIVIGIIVFLFLSFLIPFILTMRIAYRVFKNELVRDYKDKWGRVCSCPTNEEQVLMWEKGIKWSFENGSFKTEISIEHDSLKLVGEFYNFGFDKTVLILPGRCECLMYSYYYAIPYKDLGLNVLVIDTRAHGKSEGKYSTCGIKEAGDALAWMEYVHSKYKQDFYIHSICIGGCASLKAAKRKHPFLKGLIVDGIFINFKETFKNHMIEDHRPIFPVFYEIWFFFRVFNHLSINKASPIEDVKKISTPVLFLYGEEDKFSKIDKSNLIFSSCSSNEKYKHVFKHGGHSHLRINNEQEYDEAIKSFILR